MVGACRALIGGKGGANPPVPDSALKWLASPAQVPSLSEEGSHPRCVKSWWGCGVRDGLRTAGLFALAACTSATDKPSTPDDTGPHACEPRTVAVPEAGFFVDISEHSGIQEGNFDPDPPEGTAINDHSRLAFADLDGDGLDDIVMHSLFPNAANGVPFEHLVFLNNGDGTFRDHSDKSGLRAVQAGFFAFADMDNDGDQDVYAGLDLSGYGSYRSHVLLNDGSGVFSALSDSGVEASSSIAAAAVFGDFDGDGNVDLFVGNGSTFAAGTDVLYRGHGDGTFSASSALQSPPLRATNGATACDWDDDGDLDILTSSYGVSVDNGHDSLWRNDGESFTDVGLLTGYAAQITGNYYLSESGYGEDPEPGVDLEDAVGANSFGLDCADVNGDGRMDVFKTAISHADSWDYSRLWSDPSVLLINTEDHTFTNEWLIRDLPYNEGDIDGALVDFDNDGRLDLSISREDKYEDRYPDEEQHGWFGLNRQLDDGQFESMGLASGINDLSGEHEFKRMKRAQNHAWADIDHDGDLDLLVGGRDKGGGRPNFLFRNDAGQDNDWLMIGLEGDGDAVHTDAFGTRVTLSWDGGSITREKKSARGTYNSEDSRWMHFGLAQASCRYTVTVQWPDGTTVEVDGLEEQSFQVLSYPDVVR